MTKNRKPTIPATQNEGWGFWGTMTMRGHAAAGWQIAMTKIAQATQQPLESVRAFLDASQGRHFADDVRNGLDRGQSLDVAIDATVAKWMGWTTTRADRDLHDIPRGLVYLTAHVINSAERA